MDGDRFDVLTRAANPATRRTMLGATIGGLIAAATVALGREDASAGRNNRRRRRRQSWNLSAAPLTYLDEHPSSSGDSKAYNSKAQIQIHQRRNRFTICGQFQYFTDGSSTRDINVRDVIIQYGTTSSSSQAYVTFPGWGGANNFDAGCQSIARGLANDIVNDPSSYHVNIRTNHPRHLNGAVAAPLKRHN
jgi:hypothetical protein